MTGILLYSSHSQAYQNPLGPYIYLHYNPIFPCLVGPPLENKPSGPAAQELDEAKRVLEEEAALATKVHRMETLKIRLRIIFFVE